MVREKRDTQLLIRTTPEERKMFDTAAAREGMDTSSWVRRELFKEIRKQALADGRPVPIPAPSVKKGRRNKGE